MQALALLICLCLAWGCLAQGAELGHAAVKILAQRPDDELQTGTFKFTDVDVFYQMYNNSRKPANETPAVLFLHGALFKSDTWLNLGTLRLVQQAGYRVVAVDMPGYGRTEHLPYVDNNMRAEFIKAALEFAQQGVNSSLVLVTPSMSGRWAIPFLDRYGTMLAGWVAVAPAGVTQWKGPWEFTHKQVRLLAIYGEDDVMKEDATNLLKLFSSASKLIIPNAQHACYMQQPKAFHDAIIPFMATAFEEFRKEEERKRKRKPDEDY